LNCVNAEIILVSSVSTIVLLLPVAITLIIVSKPVLSHFSSTVLDLSCVRADVLSSLLEVFSSSELVKIISKNHSNNLKGFSVIQVFLPFISLELAFVHSFCQSSFVGFNNTCITADSSSSNLEKAFVILLIGSDSSF
jgi:hypothetical protein